jgi:hypothetical protein
MTDLLDIELSHLYRRLAYGQDAVSQAMCVKTVLNGRGQPSFWPFSLLKLGFAVACLAAPSGSTKLPTCRQEFLDIRARLCLRFKENGLFCRCCHSDVPASGINAQ